MITEADIQNKVTEYCRKYDVINMCNDRDEMINIWLPGEVSRVIGYFYLDSDYDDIVRSLYSNSFSYMRDVLDDHKESLLYSKDEISPKYDENTIQALQNQYIEEFFQERFLNSYDLLLAEYNQDMKEGEYDV